MIVELNLSSRALFANPPTALADRFVVCLIFYVSLHLSLRKPAMRDDAS